MSDVGLYLGDRPNCECNYCFSPPSDPEPSPQSPTIHHQLQHQPPNLLLTWSFLHTAVRYFEHRAIDGDIPLLRILQRLLISLANLHGFTYLPLRPRVPVGSLCSPGVNYLPSWLFLQHTDLALYLRAFAHAFECSQETQDFFNSFRSWLKH